MKTNKKRIATYLKLGILLLSISVLLWNCEKLTNHQKHQLPNVKKVDLSKNLNISNFIQNQTKEKHQNRIINSNIGEIDLENALQFTDSLGNVSYTIILQSNDSLKLLDFENLFVIDSNDGVDDNHKIFIKRYQPDFEWMKQHNFKFELASFTGILQHFDINYNLIFQDYYTNGRSNSNFLSRGGCEGRPGFWRTESACSGIPWDCGGDPEYCGTREVWVSCGGGSSSGTSETSNTSENNTGDGNTGASNNGNNQSAFIPNPNNNVIPVYPERTLSEVEITNFELSTKSPFNVDMTQVLDSIALPANDSTKIANQKFLCLYKKLTTSSTFKNLFINVFGNSQDVLNIEFKLTKDLKHNNEKVNGLRTVTNGIRNSSTGEITELNQLIQIDQDLLTNNSNYNAIKTIIHESIHAFLTLKKLTCNNNAALDSYNNDNISETINSLYPNFCTTNQDQHEFMFNNMLPIFKTIFEEIGKLNFTSQASLNGLSDYDLQILNQLISTNIPNSKIFDWDEFYHYNFLPGLHNTTSFENEIQNDSIKKELYKAYKYLGKNKLSKGCN